ncbi:unnamed protein product, partial [Rotaria sp. Silwood1]
MVLNYIKAKSRQVVTAHIYPKSKSSHMKFFGLNLSDTNHPRNCLRLATEIEHAFDKKYLTIIKENGQLKIFLLNKTISLQRITTVSSHTFGDIHQAPLLFKNRNRPYHRMLALHCYSAFEEAKKKQKEFLLTDADFHYST